MSKWISVKDRLPDELCKPVLVCREDMTGYFVEISYLVSEDEWADRITKSVKYWMPLPDTPGTPDNSLTERPRRGVWVLNGALPETCEECKYLTRSLTGPLCWLNTDNHLKTVTVRSEFCPFRELPAHKSGQNEWEQGYNECLNEITYEGTGNMTHEKL